MIDEFNLSGKIALIAVPEGPYGKASALALCEAGAVVCLASDNMSAAKAVQEDIAEIGYEVPLFEYDPASEASVIELNEKVIKRYNKLNIFVLNSGERFIEGWNNGTAEEIYENLKKNLMGTMLITKIMGSEIAKNKSGSVIFITSIYGYTGPDPHISEICPEMENYDFSIDRVFTFGGYINYARQVSSYLGQFNVRANTICAAPLDKPKEYADEFLKRTTLLRNAKEDDIKGLVVYLASDASSFVTGVSIPVDGGYAAK